MRRQVLFAFTAAALVGALVGSACGTPQPPLECSVLGPYWAKYTLLDAGVGSCTEYEGDFLDAQRFLPPGSTNPPTFALGAHRMLSETRATFTDEILEEDIPRYDAQDLDAGFGYDRESARGTFASLNPDSSGVCVASAVAAADQTLPAVTYQVKEADGGVTQETEPETHLKYDWSNVRILNNARFTSTVLSANVTITKDGCTATYQVDAIHPVVACSIDEECNPEANLAAGRSSGSGLQAALFAPGTDGKPAAKCTHFSSQDGYESDFLSDVAPSWTKDTQYPVGSKVSTSEGAYIATAYGTSDKTYAGPTGTGDAIQDGKAIWKYAGAATEVFTGELAQFGSLEGWKKAAKWAPAKRYVARPMQVVSNYRLYQVLEPGVSGATGPSGTGSATGGKIQDGSVVWSYVGTVTDPTNPPAYSRPWAPGTTYAKTFPHRVTNGDASYELVTAGVSGGGPTGTGSEITDGTVKWMFLNAPTRVAAGYLYFPKGVCLPTRTFDELKDLK